MVEELLRGLGGHASADYTGETEDAGAEERQGTGLRNCGRGIETDETLIGIAISGRIWRDPVKLADERGFDLSKADCGVQRGDIGVVVSEKSSGLPVDAELRATIRAEA